MAEMKVTTSQEIHSNRFLRYSTIFKIADEYLRDGHISHNKTKPLITYANN